MASPLYIGEDNAVRWDKMRSATTGLYENTATVTMVLKDSLGATVAGSAQSLAYVAGSDGRYIGNLPETLALTDGAAYTLEVTATAGAKVGFRKIPYTAQYHNDHN